MSEKLTLTPWWVAEGLGKYAMTDELLTIRAENERLREALQNIQKNAVQFKPPRHTWYYDEVLSCEIRAEEKK